MYAYVRPLPVCHIRRLYRHVTVHTHGFIVLPSWTIRPPALRPNILFSHIIPILALKYLQFQGDECTGLGSPPGQGGAQTGGYNGDIREPTWCNGSTLARNARAVASVPTLGTIFPIFVTPMTLLYSKPPLIVCLLMFMCMCMHM